MKYKVDYTTKARQDLEAIWDYISLEYQNSSSADRTIDSILDAAEQLERFPLLGPALDSIIDARSTYRFLTIGKYLVFYRILDAEIRIERILYGGRDYRSFFIQGLLDQGNA